jgi:hypothetical protein
MCKNPRGGFFWWEIIPQIFDFEIFGFVSLSNSVLWVLPLEDVCFPV